ncbi:MAG TPA: hypothetical protein VN862_01015 [Candidatus Acidoferrales bacterium]|nr:hypothetical protein [Candidatus Acidoferrales bacterium]
MFILLCVVTGIMMSWLTGRLTQGIGESTIMHMAAGFGSLLAAAIFMRAAGFANRVGEYCGPGVVTASAEGMAYGAAFIAPNRRYAYNLPSELFD